MTQPDSNSTPKTLLPDGRRTPRFAGLCTFCRFPRIDDVVGGPESVDWAIYGVPFDSGVTFRPGARFGPRAVRDASQYMKPFHPDLGVNIADELSCADAGDAPVAPFDCESNASMVSEWAAELGDRERTHLLAVGGDHSIAYSNMRATFERLGRPAGGMALLHLDAHLDTVDSVWGERWGHASPFIRAIEEKIIDPKAMLSVGIRGGLNTARDLDYANTQGVTIVRSEDLHTPDGGAAIEAFRRGVADRPVYVSIDIDVLDPAFAPGTGTPVCGGMSTREAFALLRSMRGLTIAGADIVEVLPDRDPSGITALAASHIVMEILALAAVNAAAGR